MTTAHDISFKLANQPSELDALFEKLTAFGQSVKLSKKDTFQAGLALEELFTNILRYGFADQGLHWIDFSFSYKDHTLIFKIEYEGVPFSPEGVARPDIECRLEDRKIGGLGIHFIKHCMNDFFSERCGDKNIIILKKNLSIKES